MAKTKVIKAQKATAAPRTPATSCPPSRTLRKFHPFSRLPIEIRQIIWRMLYPKPRDVCLNERCRSQCCCSYTDRPEWLKENWISFPITLYINSESRQQTLNDYTMVLYKNQSIRTHWNLYYRFCFDVKRDTLWFGDCKCLDGDDFFNYIEMLEMNIPDRIQEIKSLEIRKYRIKEHGDLLDVLKLFIEGDVTATNEGQLGQPLSALMLFSGLKQLKLIVDDKQLKKDPKLATMALREHQRIIGNYMALNKERFLDGEAPKVLVVRESEK